MLLSHIASFFPFLSLKSYPRIKKKEELWLETYIFKISPIKNLCKIYLEFYCIFLILLGTIKCTLNKI